MKRLAALSLAVVAPLGAIADTFETFGTPVGTDFFYPDGMSADGKTVVGHIETSLGTQPFLWTRSGGFQPMGTYASRTNVLPRAISPDGTAVVGAYGAVGASMRPFRWTSTGGLTNVGGQVGTATDTSTGGAVIVGTYSLIPFRWTPNDGFVRLPYISGADYGEAEAVSADGHVTVGYCHTVSGAHATMWIDNQAPVNLNELPGSSPGLSYAKAVSADGSVIVGTNSIFDAVTNWSFMYRWTRAGGMQIIDRPVGTTSGVATKVSSDGSVAAGLAYTALGANVFVWRHDLGSIDLKQRLYEHGFSDALWGWTLSNISRVESVNGKIIVVGTATDSYSGNTRGFIATIVPEPSTLMGLSVLAASLCARRRRRPQRQS